MDNGHPKASSVLVQQRPLTSAALFSVDSSDFISRRDPLVSAAAAVANFFKSGNHKTLSLTRIACPFCDDLRTGHSPDLLQAAPQSLPDCLRTLRQVDALSHLEAIENSHSADSAVKIHRYLASLIARERSIPVNVKQDIGAGCIVESLFDFDFHFMRHLLGCTDSSFSETLAKVRPAYPDGGKSGSRFCISSDGTYVVKTLCGKEEEFFRKFGPAYFWYAAKRRSDRLPSLLTDMFGAFSVSIDEGKSHITFIALRNIAQSKASLFFDLKGVGSNRQASYSPSEDIIAYGSGSDDEGRSVGSRNGPSSVASHFCTRVLWDEDFRDRFLCSSIVLSPSDHQYLRRALRNDTIFLSTVGVVDYSLFLSMTPIDESSSYEISAGIIDYIRPYTWDKKLESVVKTVNNNIVNIGLRIATPSDKGLKLLELPSSPTVIRPDLYAKRFLNNIVLVFTSV